jgi:transposase-like protein
MLQRIRLALQGESGGKLSGEVEIDETYIGGKARNMHKSVKARRISGTGGSGKAIVMGILERKGTVRAHVVETSRRNILHQKVRENVTAGSEVFTDALKSYIGLDADYEHKVIDHAKAYVEDNVHTNGLENFWSLLKRGIGGTYISVEPFHLFRYVDEQAFRYNNRKDMDDSDRFDFAVRQIVGKRLTWAEVTGKVEETQTVN